MRRPDDGRVGVVVRLGVNIAYADSAQDIRDNIDLAVAAEQAGYTIAWSAEAYGSDAVSVLAAIAGRSGTMAIGSAAMQIPARSPAMTGMTAATLDAISGGRFHLGLGVSGPQVSEGWHGVRFADPLGRTREYVHIVRQVLARRRVIAAGDHFTLPLPDGEGKALLLALDPVRTSVPIYLAAVGPRNLDLLGEIADGWLGIFFDPEHGRQEVDRIAAAAAGAGRDISQIDIAPSVPAAIGATPEAAANRVRAHAALYIGGMGSKKSNFYHRIATRMGFGEEADEVQARFLSRDYQGAAAAVPLEFLQRTCLLGDESDIAAGLRRLTDAGVTTVSVTPFAPSPAEKLDTLKVVAAAAGSAGLLA
jgi:F420-dependent oxidoreductase-like protein